MSMSTKILNTIPVRSRIAPELSLRYVQHYDMPREKKVHIDFVRDSQDHQSLLVQRNSDVNLIILLNCQSSQDINP